MTKKQDTKKRLLLRKCMRDAHGNRDVALREFYKANSKHCGKKILPAWKTCEECDKLPRAQRKTIKTNHDKI